MRQRKAKNFDEKMDELGHLLLKEGDDFAASFEKRQDLYLELGCGKGQFILSHAKAHPERNYIGIEGQETVIIHALEKMEAWNGGLKSTPSNPDGIIQNPGDSKSTVSNGFANLRFAYMFVHDVRELFAKESISGIYLNFSDPWPKARHAKRRLTYHKALEQYAEVLVPGGFIEFKTDNDGLFDFTLEELELKKDIFKAEECTRDLNNSEFTTEYEDKFRATGKNINFVRLIKK